MSNDQKGTQWSVSLIRGDLLFRLQRRVGLIPEQGLGIARRALFWSLFAWLPTAVWAWLNRAFLPAEGIEPLLAHFGVNARLLLAVPLFIFAEGMVHSTLSKILPRLVSSGVVTPLQQQDLTAVLKSVAKLRDTVYPWIIIAAILVTVFLLVPTGPADHELQWGNGQSDGIGFGAWWYLYVGRTIFLVLLLAWLWRLVLLFVLFKRIIGLGLSLVPTHPDRCAGLGFMAKIPIMFAPVVFAISSVLAAGWAHQMVYHGATVASLRTEMIGFVVALPLIFLTPYASFFGLMLKTKKQGILDYGDLIGNHGRLVRERWIDGKPVPDTPLLDAPELGPVVDIAAPYELISRMRPLPLNKGSVFQLVGAAVLPMIIPLALELPLTNILKLLLKIVV